MNDGFDPRQMAEEVTALFEKAEARIKRLEVLYSEGLSFHPVNQLRYAGFHITGVLKTNDPTEQEEQWKRARRHCQRAIYDASEMALVFCINEIDGFQEDYGKVDITPTVTNYLEIVEKTREAQFLIQTTDHESREEKYDECDQCFEELKPLVNRLNDARPELNKRLSNQRTGLFWAAAGVGVGMIAILVSIFAIYVNNS